MILIVMKRRTSLGRWRFRMKRKKLNYRFHNPNSAEATADYLCKLLIEVNMNKVERAIQEAAMEVEKGKQEKLEQDMVKEL